MCAVKTVSKNKLKEITKLHQKKYREETGLFLAEGEKILEELISANIEILDIFSLKNTNTSKFNKEITIVNEETMKKLSTTSSVCEVLTIARQKKENINSFTGLKKIVLLDSISDPGNLGTIIRSAAAFGIEGIILYGNCVDKYNPKVIRSTAGNFFKIQTINITKEKELKQLFPTHTLVATALSQKNNIELKDCKKIEKYIIMFGSEANGLNKDLINIADKNIKLKMTNNVESLNLSVCASIIFYELFS